MVFFVFRSEVKSSMKAKFVSKTPPLEDLNLIEIRQNLPPFFFFLFFLPPLFSAALKDKKLCR